MRTTYRRTRKEIIKRHAAARAEAIRLGRPIAAPNAADFVDFAATVQQMKYEIARDQQAGRVPTTVDNFGELHNYVDANEYGGFCDPRGPLAGSECEDWAHWYVNGAQDAVHAWLAAGRPKGTP